MKKIILTVIEVAVIFGLILYAVNWINSRHRGEINDQIKIENELKASNRLLEQRIGESEQRRLVLVRRVDSIDVYNQSLVRANTKLDSTLKKVKGKYNGRTVTQLESEMISRYNASK